LRLRQLLGFQRFDGEFAVTLPILQGVQRVLPLLQLLLRTRGQKRAADGGARGVCSANPSGARRVQRKSGHTLARHGFEGISYI
jgi:hypothetical protein